MAHEIIIPEYLQNSWKRACLKHGIASVGALSSLGYVISSAVAGNKIPPKVVKLGVLIGIFALFPYSGLGFFGGDETGEQIANTLEGISEPLGSRAADAVKTVLTAFVIAGATTTGGTNYATNYENCRIEKLITLIKGSSPDPAGSRITDDVIAEVFSILGYGGACIINGIFTKLLIDGLFNPLLRSCGDEETKVVVDFQQAVTGLLNLNLAMTEENYIETARWKLKSQPDDRLAQHMHAMFREMLGDEKYAEFIQEISTFRDTYTMETMRAYHVHNIFGQQMIERKLPKVKIDEKGKDRDEEEKKPLITEKRLGKEY